MCPDEGVFLDALESPRLNPFDIRACVRTAGFPKIAQKAGGLNPFDIRACVRTAEERYIKSHNAVLIPLISGHVSGRQFLRVFLHL